MVATDRFSVLVEVRLRDGIADPQGATIERALPALGLAGVFEVRAGKAFRFDVTATDEDDARNRATEVADRLLANPVIEEASVTVVPASVHPVGSESLMPPRVGVVLFPGTNCEYDAVLGTGEGRRFGRSGVARHDVGGRIRRPRPARGLCPR